MKIKLVLLGTILFVCQTVLTFSQPANNPNKKVEYLTLPPGLQAKCALYKLDKNIQKVKNRGENEKLTKMNLGREWLENALKKYEEYVTPPNVTPESPYKKSKNNFLAEGYGDKGDPAQSPLGMMQHLWLAQEGMRQRAATRNLSGPARLSYEEQQRAKKALDMAIESIEKAVKELEVARDWTTHSDGMYLSIAAPPGFFPGKNLNYRLYLTWRPRGSHEIEKALFVKVQLSEKTKTVYDYQQEAVTRERNNHPDLVVIDSNQHFRGVQGQWFTCGYTWQNKELQALVYHNLYGDYIREILYVSLANKFDEEECEGIIRSIQYQ